MSDDHFSSLERTKEFIERFVGEHGDVAFATLIMNIYSEMEDAKLVIDKLIKATNLQIMLSGRQADLTTTMCREIKEMKKSIAVLEQTKKATVH